MLPFEDQLPDRNSQLAPSPLSTNFYHFFCPAPPSISVLQYLPASFTSQFCVHNVRQADSCAHKQKKLLQLTITQQVSVIFRDCITVCPCLLSNCCLDAGAMANLSLTPNTKLSLSPQKHPSSLSAPLTAWLTFLRNKERVYLSENLLWFYVLFLQPPESVSTRHHEVKTYQNRSETWRVFLTFLKGNGNKAIKTILHIQQRSKNKV